MGNKEEGCKVQLSIFGIRIERWIVKLAHIKFLFFSFFIAVVTICLIKAMSLEMSKGISICSINTTKGLMKQTSKKNQRKKE